MRTRRRLLTVTSLWFVGTVVAALTLVHAQQVQRTDLLGQLQSRAVTSASFVSAYVQDVFEREHRLAAALSSGRRVRRPARVDGRQLTRTTRMAGFVAAVLLDDRGRVVATSPPDPALTGRRLAPRYAHLSSALAGHRAVSTVVRSAVRREPIVAFALPLRGARGGVLSGAFSLQDSPLATFLSRLSVPGARGYVVDSRGVVAAYAGSDASEEDRLDVVPDGAGPHVAHGRVVAAATIEGTPWTLVIDAPVASVLDPAVGEQSLWWAALVVGSLLGLAALVVTTTVAAARERAREQRAEAEQRLRLTFENAPIGMAVVDLLDRLVEPNRQLCQMLGYDAATLQTKTLRDLTHPDDLDVDEAQLEQLQAGSIDHYELDRRYLTAAGSVLSARLTVSLVRDTAGAPLHYVSQVQDVTDMRAAQAELHRMAMYDALTGLPNRGRLQQQLSRLLEPGPRATPVAVAFCDLDRFKEVNDSLGHPVGDEVLTVIGRRLQDAVRSGDTVGRWGGDEFVMLMPGVRSPAEAEAVLQRTRRAVEQPIVVGGHVVRVGISVGLALTLTGGQPARVLREADRALYVAKDTVRARRSTAQDRPVDRLQGAIHCEPGSPTRHLVADTPPNLPNR